jgi:choice-of-anchor C domain-containing protein
MKLMNYALALAGLSVAVSAVQAGNITIVNGDFGAPVVSGDFNTYFATDSSSIPGWTVTSGSIDLIGNYWQASPGNASGQSVDMDGDSPGTIEQTGIALNAGTATVDFDLAGNPDGFPTTKTLQVDLLGLTPQVFTFTLPQGASHENMGWVSESATFVVPSAGDYTLQFASLDQDSPYGPALDNVSMNENQSIPEGASTALLCGMSLAALAWFRWKLA